MEEAPSSSHESPPLLLKSTSLVHPPNAHKLPFSSFPMSLAILLLLFFTAPTAIALSTLTPPKFSTITSQNFLTYYTRHCNHVVPPSPLTGTPADPSLALDQRLRFDIAYFAGGNQVIPSHPYSSISFSFLPNAHTIVLTETPQVFSFQAALRFGLPPFSNMTWPGRNLREIRFRPPRIPVKRGFLVFDLYGFVSMSSGKVCMVGSESSVGRNLGGVSNLRNVGLNLDFPVNVGKVTSLISGVLESLNGKDAFGYFEPVSILGIPNFADYTYTLIDEGKENVCASGGEDESDNLPLERVDPNRCLGELHKYTRIFELEYGSHCRNDSGGKCDPLGGNSGVLPKLMKIRELRCDYGHATRVLIQFSNLSYYDVLPLGGSFDPNTMLIGEGMWDKKNKRLCVVACRTLNFRDSLVNASIGDCSVQLSLRLPRTLTIEHRSNVVGQIFSNKHVNDTGYFGRIELRTFVKRWMRVIPGQKYEYTVLDKVNKSCPKAKIPKRKGKTYPSAYSNDITFDISVQNDKEQRAVGYLTPLFVGDRPFDRYQRSNNYSGLMNISYDIVFSTPPDFKLGDKSLPSRQVKISAEGTYDDASGVLCMIGCWYRISPIGELMVNGSEDCEILIHAQLSPLNTKGGSSLKGTIESLRGKSEPLYFGQLEISAKSMYFRQAAESIWRMDMEIAMVLISNTLTCIFVGLQLYHVKKHPDVLPFLSVMMLIVLTLGHMVPLVLNFEALFMDNHNKQDVFLESGGWLEVNEVAVRVVTMVAFLLEFRLLQLSWSARQSEGNHRSFWLSEKKVLYFSLPLYIGGGLIAWYVDEWKNAPPSLYLRPRHRGFKQHYPLRDLKSYLGLIQDGFLLPQIMFNFFLNSQEKPLASAFYVGTTVVRILPHAYDLYRAHNSTWYLDLSYIYANHRHDFYSTAWNIIIPLGGLLFAALIYLQQRFGGRCMIPKRLRETSVYEKIPISGSEEQQGEAVG